MTATNLPPVPLLDVHDLWVRYGPTVAVRNADLQVFSGEIVGLIGSNGAGKSSTMAAIAGLVRPHRGTVTVDGTEVTAMQPEQVARVGVSLVPENRRIFWNLTVQQNLQIGATTRTDGSAAVAEHVEEMLGLFPVLRRYFSAPARFLSGGEQQQLAIARALLSRPKLLLLDEPSLGLSPVLVNTVFRTISLLREQGTTILLGEQFVTKTLAVADRVYQLTRGSVTASGTSEQLRTALNAERASLGRREGSQR